MFAQMSSFMGRQQWCKQNGAEWGIRPPVLRADQREGAMRRWWVVTPEFSYTDVIDPEIGGPTYDVRDVIEVEAETKRDALLLGVKAMISDRHRFEWCRDQRRDGLSPYAGVTVEPAEGD
jgi:hypothetical protein